PWLHSADWQKARNAIIGPIVGLRTEAIWELSKLLSDADHRIGREWVDAEMGRNPTVNATVHAIQASEKLGPRREVQ
ncbi:MAG: hypothetical protein WB347_11275, partial [Terriglobales bacterium]